MAETSPHAPAWLAAVIGRFERPLLRYAQRLTGDAEAARDVVQDTFARLVAERLGGSLALPDGSIPGGADDATERLGGSPALPSSSNAAEVPETDVDRVAAWLFAVCRNRAIDLRRKERRMTPLANIESTELIDTRAAGRVSHRSVDSGDDADQPERDREDGQHDCEDGGAAATPNSSSNPSSSTSASAARRAPRSAQERVSGNGRHTASPAEIVEARDAGDAVLRALATLPQNQQEVVVLKFQAGLRYKEIAEVTGLSVSNVGFLIHTALKTMRERLA